MGAVRCCRSAHVWTCLVRHQASYGQYRILEGTHNTALRRRAAVHAHAFICIGFASVNGIGGYRLLCCLSRRAAKPVRMTLTQALRDKSCPSARLSATLEQMRGTTDSHQCGDALVLRAARLTHSSTPM